MRPVPDAAVQAIVDDAAQAALKQFADKGLKPEQLAITLIDLSKPGAFLRGSYHGTTGIYPASVVKLF